MGLGLGEGVGMCSPARTILDVSDNSNLRRFTTASQSLSSYFLFDPDPEVVIVGESEDVLGVLALFVVSGWTELEVLTIADVEVVSCVDVCSS